jgi:hypothetical protein
MGKKKELTAEIEKAVQPQPAAPEAPKEEPKDPKAGWIVSEGGKRRPHP